jgi:hypothetical protein
MMSFFRSAALRRAFYAAAIVLALVRFASHVHFGPSPAGDTAKTGEVAHLRH